MTSADQGINSLKEDLTKMAVNGGSVSKYRVPFGKEMRKQFLFGDGVVNLNQGSYGGFPRPVFEDQQRLRLEAEAFPDKFQRWTTPKGLRASRDCLADVLHCPVGTVVTIPNSTTGVNTVLRNLVYAPGDHIVYFSTIYSSCENIIFSLTETTPVKPYSIPLSYGGKTASPSDADVVASLDDAIAAIRAKGGNPRAALFDTIVSMPGVRMPFEALTRLCRDRGVLSVIDGAHGIGHIPLDLSALDADFFVSNLHKWFHTPRACAVFHVPERNHHLLRTSYPTSLGFKARDANIRSPLEKLPSKDGNNDFTFLFQYTATLDYAPYMAVPAAVRFRNNVCGGEDEIMRYCNDLALRGGEALAKMFGTEIMQNAEGSLTKGVCMSMIRLPLVRSEVQIENNNVDAVSFYLERTMVDEFNTFMVTRWHGDAWWLRLSAQVYLDMDDVLWGGKVISELCARVRKGAHLQAPPA